MALKLGAKEKPKDTVPQIKIFEKPDEEPKEEATPMQSIASPVAPDAEPVPSPAPSWLRHGNEAQEAIAQQAAKADAVKNAIAQGKPLFTPRFWLSDGDSATIVFLDGDRIKSGKYAGNLNYCSSWEHTHKLAGSHRYNEFVCCEERNEDCPLCNAGDKPSLVSFFTVIDCRKIPTKDGGFRENEKKLFCAKRQTLALLEKIAVKRGDLSGCVFEAHRIGDKAARVGSTFDFQTRLTGEQLVEHFGDVKPFDYETAILYRPPELVAKLTGVYYGGGVGASSVGIGADGADDVPF